MPASLSPAPAPGEDASAALALVNTEVEPRGVRVDLPPDRRSLAGWLRDHGLAARRGVVIANDDLQRAHELRAAIRAAFLARAARRRPAAVVLTEINDAAALVPRPAQLRWGQDGPLSADRWAREAPAVDLALARIATNAIETLLGDRCERLRLCEAHGCNRMFVADHRRRRWCCRACGDRVRVARHHRRAARAC